MTEPAADDVNAGTADRPAMRPRAWLFALMLAIYAAWLAALLALWRASDSVFK